MKNLATNFGICIAIFLGSFSNPAKSAPEECNQVMQMAIEQLALPDAVSGVTCTPPMTIKISRNAGKGTEVIVIDLRDVDTFGNKGSIIVFCGKKGCVKHEVFEGKPSKLTSSIVTLDAMHSLQADRTINLMRQAQKDQGIAR